MLKLNNIEVVYSDVGNTVTLIKRRNAKAESDVNKV